METNLLLLLFVLVLCLFCGFEVVAQTPSKAHLPLLSGFNLFSGVVVLVALLSAGLAYGGNYDFAALTGGFATAFTTAGAAGGYLLASRMLDETPPEKEK